ncbi:MAG: DEAD/DEAH box helicase [Acholeplasmataceae bacterium]|nr:DEAD/DEAH box helicase [Acholeplasmataceae bacterium]
MIVPRDYQSFALDAWLNYVADGKTAPLLLYPTGVGKSVILALIIAHCLKSWPGLRAMILTHSKELIQQDYDKLMDYWPEAVAGIYCAGLKRQEYYKPITVGSIQTVYNVPELFAHVDLLFIDEAHLISLKEQSMYRSFIEKLKERNPNLVVTGLTATGWRSGQGMLHWGENALFDGIAVDACSLEAFNWFIDEGYLVPPVAQRTKFQYDVSKVKTTAGEFNQKELDAAVNITTVNEQVVLLACEAFEDRNHGLTFCTGTSHVENIAAIYNHYGVRTTFVHTKVPGKERDRRIEAYLAGDYQMMVNNGILTTGFDFPALDYIAMMKATRSSSLWVQMLGRGTRPLYHPGFDLSTRDGRLAAIMAGSKPDCLVSDFAKNTERLGPVNDPVIPVPRGMKKPGEAPIRICDQCGTYNHASAPLCIACGFEFPRREKLQAMTTGKALVKRKKIPDPVIIEEPQILDFPVDHVTYKYYRKSEEHIPSVRVSYKCGIRTFDEWVFLDKGSPFQGKGRNWWIQRAECSPAEIPETASQALTQTDILRIPTSLKVQVNTKHPRITEYVYK